MSYRLEHLEELEAESIFVLREAFAQFENPCILFSGGKDSIVVAHLAVKAFYPAKIPFPLVHIDTGHNFDETIAFRDKLVQKIGAQLVIGSVQEAIDNGLAQDEKGVHATRNTAQIPTLIDTIEKNKFDAAMGGARRDEEKARAKERFFSHRDDFGQWDPKNQRPELWNLYNAKVHKGENIRAFPISNWTEMDVWQYIEREKLELPSIYFAHTRDIVKRSGAIVPITEVTPPMPGEKIENLTVRFRTVGDITCTAPVLSKADTIEKIIMETASTVITERGETRLDDQVSDASMEQRKKEGYF
jgi:sulfate adenylyltransferase subunit 2